MLNSTNSAACPACGSNNGELLQPPQPARSITSGGVLIDVPLVLVFQHGPPRRRISPLTAATRDRLLEGRRRYFRAWEALADRLALRVRGAPGPVLNFGASFWSLLLAAYCPEYWERVDACVVDDFVGTFLGKPVMRTESVPDESSPMIVLGVNPASQVSLAQRLAGRGEVVIWNDLISQ